MSRDKIKNIGIYLNIHVNNNIYVGIKFFLCVKITTNMIQIALKKVQKKIFLQFSFFFPKIQIPLEVNDEFHSFLYNFFSN